MKAPTLRNKKSQAGFASWDAGRPHWQCENLPGDSLAFGSPQILKSARCNSFASDIRTCNWRLEGSAVPRRGKHAPGHCCNKLLIYVHRR